MSQELKLCMKEQQGQKITSKVGSFGQTNIDFSIEICGNGILESVFILSLDLSLAHSVEAKVKTS